jgi:hypothetical protein
MLTSQRIQNFRNIKIDNNLAENEIRPITLGRKNYLFCGNHKATKNMCTISSVLSTCKNHDVNPCNNLNWIIAKMPYMEKATHEQLLELLPHRWKQHEVVETVKYSHRHNIAVKQQEQSHHQL